jgi:hypothetical protein
MPKNLPTVAPSRAAVAKVKKTEQRKLITILKDDFSYDIVKEIVKHMGELKRAKKIKPLEKHRMLMNYNLTLLSYCMPKMKVLEDDRSKTGDKIQFNINVGGNEVGNAGQKGSNPTPTGGVNITIPTVKKADGSLGVDITP